MNMRDTNPDPSDFDLLGDRMLDGLTPNSHQSMSGDFGAGRHPLESGGRKPRNKVTAARPRGGVSLSERFATSVPAAK